MSLPFTIARTAAAHELNIVAKMANRHGLIAGATGTGKTVTLRKMAECFSDAGIPVFLLDVKAICQALLKQVSMRAWLPSAWTNLA